MANNLRKSVLLGQFDKINETIDASVPHKPTLTNRHEDSSEEENDTLGELTNCNSLNFQHHSKSTSAVDDDPVEGWDTSFEARETIISKERNMNFNLYASLPKEHTGNSIPIFIFHHGAGSSGLSFANLCKQLMNKLDGKCGCFAFDARGHGQTTVIDSNVPVKYNQEDFIEDLLFLISYISENHLRDIPIAKRSIILVGHSLGGSICTFTVSHLSSELKRQLIGVAMLDIVEEAAVDALKKVDHFLASTPNVFPTYKEAVEWHIKHGLSKNRESAKIAIPALFRKFASGKVVRITNLSTFRPFWDTWFTGLSHKFVTLPTSRLLILAGNDNLDRELIIGQIQGKYQLVVFQDSGHFIQEDAALKTALTLIEFWKRNDNKNVVIQTNWGQSKK
ncbi:carboxylesterase-mitochondrial 37S ribosomal protein YmS2 [Maudiozyma humilis]|uniref:Protein phosphatase methylesterase 1 n=1 Tax=Maudiozyma humilis TaxID=51915 RepID=A0AAV5RTM5_MAUHU|nr:carboxylesterase-mitochondrial 37S ribosomal protein YmS2 [Kazachstania humilis]